MLCIIEEGGCFSDLNAIQIDTKKLTLLDSANHVVPLIQGDHTTIRHGGINAELEIPKLKPHPAVRINVEEIFPLSNVTLHYHWASRTIVHVYRVLGQVYPGFHRHLPVRTSMWTQHGAVRHTDKVIDAVKTECLADETRGEGRAVLQCAAIAALDVRGIAISRPPTHQAGRRRDTRWREILVLQVGIDLA